MKNNESIELPQVTDEMLESFGSGISENFEDCKSIEEIRAERIAKQKARREQKKKDRRSRLINNLSPVMAFALFLCTVAYLNSLQFGLVISYNDSQIATVENAEVVEEATNIINDKIIMKSLDSLEDEPQYKVAVINNNSEFENSAELSRKILENDNVLTDEVCGIFVDNTFVGAAASEEEAQKVLNEILADVKAESKDMGNVESVEFNGGVSLRKGLYAKSAVVDNDTLKDRLLNNVELSYKITVFEDKKVKIKYKTEYTVDETKPSGYEKVSTAGQYGEGVLTNKVTYIDGVEVSTEKDKVIATKKPVNEVITVSADHEKAIDAEKTVSNNDTDASVENKTPLSEESKADNPSSLEKRESTEATSNTVSETSSDTENVADNQGKMFIWPAPTCYSITNEFGYQGEKLHKGIDISGGAAEGQPIAAAADGYVTTVVFDYGTENYGCYLIIDHGNGYQTLYAQCSDIYVKPGDSVKQGDIIAAIGSTGDSTGAHLHFEIIEYGSYVNPTNYLY